jgi:D-alanine-D-alanine ligase
MKKKVALIFGGRSSEHEISVRSIKNVYEALDKNLFEAHLIGISKEGSWYHIGSADSLNKLTALTDSTLPRDAQSTTLTCQKGKPCFYLLDKNISFEIDIAFPVLHGTFGEDGTIQGLFKMMNLPFVGTGVLGSSMGMDKEIMKRLLTYAGIKNARYAVLKKDQPVSYTKIKNELGLPFFIKPSNSGSSVGVHKIKSEADFEPMLKESFQYDEKVLAEEFVEGREIEISVLGPNDSPEASLPGEIILHHEFYSYEAKYLDEKGATTEVPAKLSQDEVKRIQEIAIKTFELLCCDGFTRIDFFMKKSGEIYINEINTIPGFTSISMYPKMWEASGLSYSKLITRLIELGLEKHKRDNQTFFNYLALNR